jgi:hypothetical protein
MSITQDDLFYGAHRDAGLILLPGTGLNAEQTEEARKVFNRLVDSLRMDGLKCWRVSRVLFPLVSKQGSYGIGPDGDWVVTRAPVNIQRGSVIVTSTTPTIEYPMEKLSEQEYQEWRLKDLSTSWPAAFYYERPMYDGSSGQLDGTVHLMFVPGEANQAALYLEESISPIDATGNSILEFPVGYQEVIETNMAKTLAARDPRSKISPLTIEAANKSMRAIKIANFRPRQMESDYPTNDVRQHDGWGNRRW